MLKGDYMTTRSYPENYFNTTETGNTVEKIYVPYYVPYEQPQGQYIPKEIWILLGIAIGGLIMVSLYAIYKLKGG